MLLLIGYYTGKKTEEDARAKVPEGTRERKDCACAVERCRGKTPVIIYLKLVAIYLGV